jgi:pimeloyl-ACP methyl ester carboxylesterase
LSRLTPENQIPILLLRGSQSDVLSDANVADFRHRLPWAEVRDVPGAGHMIAGDNNEVFTRIIGDYLVKHLPIRLRTGVVAEARSI